MVLPMQSVASGAAALVLITAGSAAAHVAIASGPAKANQTNEISFSVGHGCGTDDTLGIQIEIPAGVTNVRALRSDFSKPAVVKEGTQVTSVTWTKPVAELQDEDVGYYLLKIRAKVPDAPFTVVHFKVHQYCRSMAGIDSTVDWVALPGEEGEAAAALPLVPLRYSGWNQFTVPATAPAIVAADLPTFLGDAQIVWKGTEAYSPNPTTTSLIGTTGGVTALTAINPGDVLWVKY